jgi:hypothetical protein
MRILVSTFLFLIFLFVGVKDVSAQILNEFVPNADTEWVEILNNSSSTIDLSGYFFDDDSDFNADNGSSAKISLQGIITPGALCYWEMNRYLNNDTDSPTLFGPDGAILDSYPYSSTSLDKSYARVPDGGAWQADREPTKTGPSCQSLAPTSTPTPTQAPTATPVPTSTSAPTPTPTPTPKPTSSPTPKPSPTKGPTSLVDTGEGGTGDASGNTDILGLRAQLNESQSSEESVLGESTKRSPVAGIVLGSLGALLIGVSSVIFLKRKGFAYNKESEEIS